MWGAKDEREEVSKKMQINLPVTLLLELFNKKTPMKHSIKPQALSNTLVY